MRKAISITGVADSRSARTIAGILKNRNQGIIIVSGRARAEKLSSDISFFCDRPIYILPEEEHIFLNYSARDREDAVARLMVQKALRRDKRAIVIAPVSAGIKKLVPHRDFEEATEVIQTGQSIGPEEAKKLLQDMGYERSYMAEVPGKFSVRGGILDFFPPDMTDPIRIEFFGDEIESIRAFDAETQRSIERLESVEIFPAKQITRDEGFFRRAAERIKTAYDRQIEKLRDGGGSEDIIENLLEREGELLTYIDNRDNTQLLEDHIHYFYDETEYIWDYMLDGGTVIVEDPSRIEEHLKLREMDGANDFRLMLERGRGVPEDEEMITGREDYYRLYESPSVYTLLPFPYTFNGPDELTDLLAEDGKEMMVFSGHMDVLGREIKRLLDEDYRVILTASSGDRENSLNDYIKENFFSGNISVVRGNLSSGMEYPGERIAYISDNDIFGSGKIRAGRRKKTRGQKLQSFTDLKTGDYVVHESYGIGIFVGIEPLVFQDEKRDYIKIKYAGTDTLYVPVEQMDMVQKYIGSEGAVPKLNKLSGEEWHKAKTKAKAAIAEMTGELIKLYAARKSQSGYAFGTDSVWQREFESAFPYEETDDQLRSIEEIKEDMQSDNPMDRLLCGDVGYGKTEVAARAIFKCLENGKQAAILVPTTILANQHYNTLKERFSGYPFSVEMLSRFRSDAEQKEIVRNLGKGMVDLVIGTHRLLSEDVKFRDLGLLVVDEEQRFGVKHKEKIKELKANIDVLTLSATPIPRTLNMSLTGIRDMSLITEPPEERYPVQTYVLEEDDDTLREVIRREIDRGGQVFVVYNRVRGIIGIGEKLAKLVPEARIAIGHGQMNESALEEVMDGFINGEYDVLLATTIIESGIDIPNANTMIVIDADKCGLAQLYQLRGRVGRSNKVGYAYLTYKKNKVLSETAVKRLRAIKEFTEFGSGFKIAMRDMEIRGAGNLLGAEQSGHIMDVGYELYCKMVDEAVKAARGETVPDLPEDITVELKAPAGIPDWYIDDETLKLEMYKKISLIENPGDMDEIGEELTDRFGEVPKETRNLLKISLIRKYSGLMALARIYEYNNEVILNFNRENLLNPFALMKTNQLFGEKVFFHGGKEPYIKFKYDAAKKLDDTIELLGILIENKDKRA